MATKKDTISKIKPSQKKKITKESDFSLVIFEERRPTDTGE